MDNDNKQRQEAALRALEQFLLEDRPSGDAVRLENAIELAMHKLDDIAGNSIRESTIRRYNVFMKALSDDVAAYIKQRREKAPRQAALN